MQITFESRAQQIEGTDKFTAEIVMVYGDTDLSPTKVWSWLVTDDLTTMGVQSAEIAEMLCATDFAIELHAVLQFFQMTRQDGNMIVVATPD